MTKGGTRWIALGALSVLMAAAAFEAGRRYPFERVRRTAPRAPSRNWEAVAVTPFQRYEFATTVIGRRLYVFGGFSNVSERVSWRVDAFDPATATWTRMGDMPTPATHRHGAVVGDTVWFAGGFLGDHPGTATNEVWGYHPATDTWFKGPPLPLPVAGGAHVSLGRRLHYFGGYAADRTTTVGNHWTLDLDGVRQGRGEWRSAAPLPLPRGHLSAVVVGDYAYAIGGGVGHDPLQIDQDAVHRYDPKTDTWKAVSPLPAPRSHFEGSTFVLDGKIVIAGGRNTNVAERYESEVTVYDPAADVWTTTLRLPEPVLSPAAGAFGDTIIAGLGREFGRPSWDSTMWMHRLVPGWLAADPMPFAMDDVAGGVIGSRLFLVGSASNRTLAHDLAVGRWLNPDDFATRPGPGGGNAAEVVDGKLYLIGGTGRPAGLVRIFDPARNHWSFGPKLPFRAGGSATATIGGRIYAAGGVTTDTVVAGAARLDPGAGEWTPLAPLPRPRGYAAAGTDGHRLYVFGGRRAGPRDSAPQAAVSDDVQVYDPVKDAWIVSGTGDGAPAPLPHPHGRASKAVYADGRFWLFGGEGLAPPAASATQVTNHVDVYDPVSNTWSMGPPMRTARRGALAVALGGHVYVAGGGVRSGSSSSSIFEILRLPPRSDTRQLSSASAHPQRSRSR